MWYNNLKAAACAAARVQGTRLCANAQGLRTLNHAKPQQARFCWGRFAAEIFDLPGGIPLQLFDAHMHYSDTHEMCIRDSYHHLTIEERSCIRKYYVDGLSYREIARLIGRNVSTVSRRCV